MAADGMVLPVLAVVFLATLIRSAFGFGEALVAVPLLALLIPVEVAAPLAVLLSITVAGVVVVQNRHQVHVRSAAHLVLATLFGIPLGLWLLTSAAEQVIKAVLAVIILAFSSYCLVTRSTFTLRDDRLAWVFGFAAGVLGDEWDHANANKTSNPQIKGHIPGDDRKDPGQHQNDSQGTD